MADNSALGKAAAVFEKPAQAVRDEAAAVGQTIVSQVTGIDPNAQKERDQRIVDLAKKDQRYVAAELAGDQAELREIIAEKQNLVQAQFQEAQSLGVSQGSPAQTVQERHEQEEKQAQMTELEQRKKAPKPIPQSSGRGEMRGGRGVGG